ncbi:MAG: hypothetical protein AB7K24_20505 [Gemmataceae bacterium]
MLLLIAILIGQGILVEQQDTKRFEPQITIGAFVPPGYVNDLQSLPAVTHDLDGNSHLIEVKPRIIINEEEECTQTGVPEGL